ncbi:MAG: UbiA family prenyltransferase [Lachnospiraceae bacterium]|nr:UbiA family prenyltransferase [Lachnospiraceae bacterium]
MTTTYHNDRKSPAEAGAASYERLTATAAFRLAAMHTWPASVCPALFGIFWCLQRGLPLSPVQAVLLLAACILSQSAVNTLNDYVDYVSGTDSEADNVEVNDSVLVYSHVNPKHALVLGLVYLASAAACGVIAAWHAGPAPYIVGLIGGLTVIAYSIGPLPVASLPLGEAVSGFVMGALIPLGTAAAADGTFHWEILAECLPLILGIALIMLSNNGSDIEKDIPAGRMTLPVYLGRPAALTLYRGMLGAWIALLCIQPLVHLGGIGILSILLTLVLGRGPFSFLIRAKLRPEDRIRQMKSITAANMIGNGLLALAYAAAWLLKLLA